MQRGMTTCEKCVFLLLLLLLLLTLSGCGDSIAPETEKVSLTALQYELENQTLDFDNMWFSSRLRSKQACMSISTSSSFRTGRTAST